MKQKIPEYVFVGDIFFVLNPRLANSKPAPFAVYILARNGGVPALNETNHMSASFVSLADGNRWNHNVIEVEKLRDRIPRSEVTKCLDTKDEESIWIHESHLGDDDSIKVPGDESLGKVVTKILCDTCIGGYRGKTQ